ncbi:helix-turn-helix domain-containing protein [Acidocella aromatica]|uniref:CRP/FNR family nitrogen fixation transcriptional regulator n=1 Tax=Acidocella aromatica TaxID=1303579 RepID=A0A840VS24_9PROT|nr:helix-turn-helix domain-containing protein [Acidocella aromatica]MBB5374130.1 CRP/FNR family nitrogen fixation transcriptional regulator [Acidocella aromatica]
MSASVALRGDNSFAIPKVARVWSLGLAGRPAEAPFSPAPLHFAQDAEIYAEGDEASYVYKVVSGMVRTCKFQNDGRRHIDAFHKPGDMLGFELGAEHALSAEAVTDCMVVPYRRRTLETQAGHDETAAMQLYTYAMQSLERTRQHAQLLGRGSAPQKLSVFLLELAGAQGEEVELAMTRQDIADYLGLTIETVSRTLSHLERDGTIRLAAARRIELSDRAALRALCG